MLEGIYINSMLLHGQFLKHNDDMFNGLLDYQCK